MQKENTHKIFINLRTRLQNKLNCAIKQSNVNAPKC